MFVPADSDHNMWKLLTLLLNVQVAPDREDLRMAKPRMDPRYQVPVPQHVMEVGHTS